MHERRKKIARMIAAAYLASALSIPQNVYATDLGISQTLTETTEPDSTADATDRQGTLNDSPTPDSDFTDPSAENDAAIPEEDNVSDTDLDTSLDEDESDTDSVLSDEADSTLSDETDSALSDETDSPQEEEQPSDESTPTENLETLSDEVTYYADSVPSADGKEAEIQPGTYYIASALNQNMVLDVTAASPNNGTKIQLYTLNSTPAQKWILDYTSDGYIRFINEGSKKALDVRNGAKGSGVQIQQFTWNQTKAQKWKPVQNSNGSYTFYSALDPSVVLDVYGASTSNGTKIHTFASNGTAAQQFYLYPAKISVPSAGKVIEDGCYSLLSSQKHMVMDLAGASNANGAGIQIYPANGTSAQSFYLKYESDGYYRIRNINTMKAVDLKGGGLTPGTVLNQWEYSSSNDNQKWQITANGDGSYRIVSVKNGLSMDAGKGTTGTIITTQKNTDSASQKWYFQKVTPSVAPGCYMLTSVSDQNKAVDIAAGTRAENGNAQIYSVNKTLAQKWQVRTEEEGIITLQNIGSGLYLAVSDNGNVCQRSYKAKDPAARWKLMFQNGAGYTLQNCKNGNVLSISGNSAKNFANIATSQANGSSAQQWKFTSAPLLEEGFYEFAPSANTGLRIDVAAASLANGANVQAYTSNGTLAQRWWVRSCGNGWYTLTACCSAKALDVQSGSAASGANAQQWQPNGTNAQKWRFKMGEKGLVLESALGTVLTISPKVSSGSNIQMGKGTDTSNREWMAYEVQKPTKIGWQNPSQYYQVSPETVKLPNYCTGYFTYVTPSRIKIDATREDCVEAFIARVFEYSGTPYKWGYSCAPGVGVDCSGLVIQGLYAVGMETAYNPYIHPTQENTTGKMLADPKFKKVSVGERRRGDLIFYPGHVGIYLGNDQIINANPSGVKVQSVWSWEIKGVVRPFV